MNTVIPTGKYITALFVFYVATMFDISKLFFNFQN